MEITKLTFNCKKDCFYADWCEVNQSVPKKFTPYINPELVIEVVGRNEILIYCKSYKADYDTRARF